MFLEDWIEVFWRWWLKGGPVRCWSFKKSETTDFEFFRVLILSYFSICHKFSQSKALTSELCFFFGNMYRMEQKLGITGPLLSILFYVVFAHKFQSETHTHISSKLLLNKLHICVITNWGVWNWYFILKKDIIIRLRCNQSAEPGFLEDFCYCIQTKTFPIQNLLYILFGLSTLTIWWILDQLPMETINGAGMQQDHWDSSK